MSKFNGLSFLCCLSAIIASLPAPTSSASYCEVPESNISFVYNLTKLWSDERDIIIKHADETIRMQLCTSLKKKCNNRDGYAICLMRNDTEKGIGKFPPKINNTPGKISFIFTGDNCTPETKYTVQIIMQCDYNVEDNSHPELFPHRDEQCNLFMIWRTAFACAPRTRTNCTVTYNDLHFDLSPLTRSSENYAIRMGTDAKSPKIMLNVCQSVIRHGAVCPIKSGACLDDPQRSNRYSSLGEVRKPPFFRNGSLQIEYQDGALCTENITTPHVKTTIMFICDVEATESIPEYIGGREDCHYYLVWYTAAACSIESLRSYSSKTAGRCTVTNPVTNFTYNLQSLMNETSAVTNKNGMQYKLKVCGALTDNACKTNAGVCNPRNGTSLGQANTNLKWQQGGPYLNYTNGDLCGNGMRRYTIIAFFCGPEGSASFPVLMEERPCQTVIHWNTDLVCEKRIKCATDNDDEINLTPLIKSTNNYVVRANDVEFHINVCRPLVLTQGLTCAHGSAACKVSVTSQNEYINEVSLGFPEESPTLNKDLRTVLRYVNGSQCPEDPTRLISSNFTFVCANNNQGLPVYKHYVNCTYVFEWNTSIACGAVIGDWSSPCTIKDSFRSYEYDLSLLYKEQQVKNKQGKYGINICGGENYCTGSAVCHEGNGYGSLGSVIFDYSRHDVKLKYSNGSKCNNNSYTSEVRFICNESIGIGAPRLLLESQCSAEFEWHTEVICAKHANSHHVDREEPGSSSGIPKELSPSHGGTVAVVLLAVIAALAALIYFRNPGRRTCFRSWASICSFRRGDGRVQYCRVDTTEEARLLLDASDPTQCQTDSDDDLLHA
ncbi:cation-independent mannose-6-phosphate receptor isoform X2 [Ooceraea biroi]|uniref:cation-independent mannose-6-phosphate receptor isoform X2 n=1 Tax=Ooceraea biroi TaxID=2015173 RepID=UPI0005BC240C|nr:cation-independent mannose-6-phosphate receptor isoform X2 [Ooceraea biroi]